MTVFRASLLFVFFVQGVFGTTETQKLRKARDICLVDFEVDFDFVNFNGCSFNRDIRGPLISMLNQRGCTHRNDWKQTIILESQLGNLKLAKQWVQQKCEAKRVPKTCSNGLASLNLPSVGKCSNMQLRSAVNDAMTADCRHNVMAEMRLLYRDNHPNNYVREGPEFDVAMSWLVQECYQQYGCTVDSLKGLRLRECDTASVKEVIAEKMPGDCPHTLEAELALITGTQAYDQYIHDMCTDAWENIALSTQFTDIDPNFNGAFMKKHNLGLGYLNEETGNFRGDNDPAYPISTDSLTTGINIDMFYKATETPGSGNSVLRANFDSFDQCENQSVMCCWGRDRQSGDENGTCERGAGNCDDENPSDNTNLCYAKDFTPYPRNAEEAIHCHGFAWGDDENDPISQLKMNVYFYVAMHDHMYSRGYVERITDDTAFMCGCVEDMPVVTRSDCSQVRAKFNLRLIRDESNDHRLSVVPDDMTGAIGGVVSDLDVLEVTFAACRGLRPDGDTGNLVMRNNDLAAHARQLNLEDKLSDDKLEKIFETLAGHSTLIGNNGPQVEEVCRQSYCDNAPVIAPNTYDCSV